MRQVWRCTFTDEGEVYGGYRAGFYRGCVYRAFVTPHERTTFFRRRTIKTWSYTIERHFVDWSIAYERVNFQSEEAAENAAKAWLKWISSEDDRKQVI